MSATERAELEKLFTQKLANYGVLAFNFKAIQKESQVLFAEIEEIKLKLESAKNEK